MKKTLKTFLVLTTILIMTPQVFASRTNPSAERGEARQSLSERSQADFEEAREARKTEITEFRERNKEHFENLREERKNRLKEEIEIRKQQREDGKQENRLESRGVNATLKGADFDYNSETGVVTITTPSGQEHELNHLPDQAIERMKKLLYSDFEDTQVEIEADEDGGTIYKARGKKKKKFLGLIPRDIDIEAVLDDETGEVTEAELPAESVLGRLLDRFSF